MSDNAPPLVSVVLPVRDGAEFLVEAVESLLTQTLTAIEVLIVENGSTDATAEVAERLAGRDSRVRLLSPGPIGLVAALNLGLEKAQGTYVARMDADDRCEPTRFACQVAHLEANPSCVVVGTAHRYVDDRGIHTGTRRPATGADAIRAAAWFGNPIAHPTVMFAPGRVVPPLRYSAGHPDAEDFELWLRLGESHDLANLPESLVDYRRHGASVTAAPTSADRASSIAALAEHASRGGWRADRARSIAAGTFNAVQGRVGLGRFLLATARLNAANLHSPLVPRATMALRSAIAVASVLRRTLR